MPRELESLPRWGYSHFLDVPHYRTGQPKSREQINDRGECMPRWKGKPRARKHRGDVLITEVWCTVCKDEGCDRCPPYLEEQVDE